MDNYKRGDKVFVNGDYEGTILGTYAGTMYEVRIISGTRHVGDVVVSKGDLRPRGE